MDHLVSRKLLKEVLEILLEIDNGILRGRVFSDDWEKSGIFLIPKTDKIKLRPIVPWRHVCARFYEGW
jgi:hypothetical protein